MLFNNLINLLLEMISPRYASSLPENISVPPVRRMCAGRLQALAGRQGCFPKKGKSWGNSRLSFSMILSRCVLPENTCAASSAGRLPQRDKTGIGLLHFCLKWVVSTLLDIFLTRLQTLKILLHTSVSRSVERVVYAMCCLHVRPLIHTNERMQQNPVCKL